MPKFNVVGHDVFFESIEIPITLDEFVSNIQEVCKYLSDPPDARDMGLPMVRFLSMVSAHAADSLGQVGMGCVLRKKLFEC